MSEKNKKQSFKEKYPAMDNDAVKKEIAVQKSAKDKMTAVALEIEQNFTAFGEILDPMEWINPNTGKKVTIAMIRRPRMKQMKEMIPPEMAKYAGKQVPKELETKYEMFVYQKMSEMIAIPEKTAKEWERDASPWFMRRFWKHIEGINKLVEGDSAGFLEPQ